MSLFTTSSRKPAAVASSPRSRAGTACLALTAVACHTLCAEEMTRGRCSLARGTCLKGVLKKNCKDVFGEPHGEADPEGQPQIEESLNWRPGGGLF